VKFVLLHLLKVFLVKITLYIYNFNNILALYFNVGIAVADRIVEFGQTIRPICLPFQPIDDADHLQGKFVNLAGWGTKNSSNDWISTNLRIYNLKVCCVCEYFQTISEL